MDERGLLPAPVCGAPLNPLLPPGSLERTSKHEKPACHYFTPVKGPVLNKDSLLRKKREGKGDCSVWIERVAMDFSRVGQG